MPFVSQIYAHSYLYWFFNQLALGLWDIIDQMRWRGKGNGSKFKLVKGGLLPNEYHSFILGDGMYIPSIP